MSKESHEILKQYVSKLSHHDSLQGTSLTFLQVVLSNGYMAPNSAALAVAKIYPEAERAQKITLDIGAGTGLLAEEVLASRPPPPFPKKSLKKVGRSEIYQW